jgi:hypothetical protein
MLKLNDFILLKAIYNEQLHNAVLAKDRTSIVSIVKECYIGELKDGYVRLESIDTDRLYKEHTEQLSDDNMLKRMI